MIALLDNGQDLDLCAEEIGGPVEDGHSIEEVAQFLGHENSHITFKVYARYSPSHLRKLAASLQI